jgi:TonB-dependent starch-binding outer membrane protein SusC
MKKCKKGTALIKRLVPAFAVIFILLAGFSARAQSPVKGIVRDRDGNAVTGATITVKGKNISTASSSEGTFSILAGSGDVLVISSVGFENYEIKVAANAANLNIQLVTNINLLSDVVVVGYGTQKKKDLTGSVSNINVNDLKKYTTSDISQLLQGRAAGVVVNSDGQPGASPNIRIRGFSTFGGSEPFYVVDGVPGTSIRDFSPNDVETVTVLKDASAAAIYGAAAANGVIIITTKQGRKNTAMKVSYNGYYGADKVWQIQDVTDRQQYQLLNNESRVNAGKPLFPANDPSNPGYVSKINTDWQKEGLKTGTRQNHNISLSGGGTNNTYNLSLDYYDQKGTYVGNGPDYKRYTARINTSAEKGILKIGESFNYTHSHENTLTFRDEILLGGCYSNHACL